MKLPFDKIYCLHITERQDRFEFSKEEFIKMGIYDDVDYWWTCHHPYTKEIHSFLLNNNIFRTDNPYNRESAYNCARNWYEVIKTSYLRGYEHILCIEDDIKFNISKEDFEKFMKRIPDNYEVIRFGYLDGHIFKNNECFYIQDYSKFIYGNQMFALNRSGMKYYIDYMDEHYGEADFPFACIDYIKLKGITTYFASKNFYDVNYISVIKSEICED